MKESILPRAKALLLLAVLSSSCSTIATTAGDFRTDNLIMSGTRHVGRNLYSLAHTPMEAVPARTPSMIGILFIDFPFSLVADVVLLPATLPMTLSGSGKQADPSDEVSE